MFSSDPHRYSPYSPSSRLFLNSLYASPGASDAASSYPRLIRVAMMYNDKVGYGPTVRDALNGIFGPGAGATATGPASGPRPASSTPSSVVEHFKLRWCLGGEFCGRLTPRPNKAFHWCALSLLVKR